MEGYFKSFDSVTGEGVIAALATEGAVLSGDYKKDVEQFGSIDYPFKVSSDHPSPTYHRG